MKYCVLRMCRLVLTLLTSVSRVGQSANLVRCIHYATWYWAESNSHGTFNVSQISLISHTSVVWVPSIITWRKGRNRFMSALNVLFAETRVMLGVMPCYSWTGDVKHSILVGSNRPARLLSTCSQVSSCWPLLQSLIRTVVAGASRMWYIR
jgi:hypothetical protein